MAQPRNISRPTLTYQYFQIKGGGGGGAWGGTCDMARILMDFCAHGCALVRGLGSEVHLIRVRILTLSVSESCYHDALP